MYQKKLINMSNESHVKYSSRALKLKRLWRSIRMWGIHRTFAKVCNRTSIPIPPVINLISRKRDTLLVGCGQFGASTASFFISKEYGNRFLACYDIDKPAAERVSRAYGYNEISDDFQSMLKIPGAKYVFIASNHASHTAQSIAALKQGLVVHVEKPVSVNWEQLADLTRTVAENPNRLFVGYNRPFSKAFQELRTHLPDGNGPFTIDCFVAGHAIDPTHWYYDPKEGTRICGNVGHWIDMSVHLLSLRKLPENLQINLSFSDEKNREENITITMTSDLGDLINMTFTTRGEPFDGVNESINIQQGGLMAKIADFRRMDIWKESYHKTSTYRPKDVGHRASVVQMYSDSPELSRPWTEVFNSTALMLQITDMVRSGKTNEMFSFKSAKSKVDSLSNSSVLQGTQQ